MSEAEIFISSMKEDEHWITEQCCVVCESEFENGVDGWVDEDGLGACWECMWQLYGMDSKSEKDSKGKGK